MNHYDDLQRFQEKTRTQNLKFQDLSSQAATREHGDWAILNQLNPDAGKPQRRKKLRRVEIAGRRLVAGKLQTDGRTWISTGCDAAIAGEINVGGSGDSFVLPGWDRRRQTQHRELQTQSILRELLECVGMGTALENTISFLTRWKRCGNISLVS